MLRCTYIVLIHNNESNITKLVNSLKKIKGNFHKEFIFVDDGSTDNSLSELKLEVNDIARTTIITQEAQGPSISINKALSLATGDYIHFATGDEVLSENSTSLLIEGCKKFKVQVAIGLVSSRALPEVDASLHSSPELYKVIENPVSEILLNKIKQMRNVGKSGCIVHSALLDSIGKADSSVYTQNMSLSLRCAKYSKFVLLNEHVTSLANYKAGSDVKFQCYNNIKSIYNFSKENVEIASKLSPELLMVLSMESLNKSNKLRYLIKYFMAKYIKPVSLDSILALYWLELEKLF